MAGKVRHRHCERSEAIQNLPAETLWIASSLALLAMAGGDTSPYFLSLPSSRLYDA